jgi:ABC-type multidrug transport system fused ATPase/permease subunit
MNVIKKLKIVLNKKQKQRVILLCILIMIGALLETLGVGVISPLISAVVSPETILENDVVKTILSITGMEDISNEGFVRILLLVTIAVFIFKNAYLLFVSFVQSRFIAWTQSSTSVRLMGDYLNRPYEYYLNADVNVMIQTVNKDIPHIFELLQEFMLLITEIAVSFCICTFLLVLAPVMTLSLAALLGVMILLILLVFKPRLRDLGHERIDAQNNMMKWMQQSVFGIKDVKVAAKENYFLGRFEKGRRCFCITVRHRGYTLGL